MPDFLLAFGILGNARTKNGGIPLSEIRQYMDEFEIYGEDREEFIRIIYAMNNAWCESVNKKLENMNKANTQKK